jgi:ABC-type Na+ efflux pump permease subunit
MGGSRKLLTLIEKDFCEFFSSKSWIVILVLPLFITFLYSVIYRQAETKIFTVACSTNVNPVIHEIFKAPQLKLKIYQDLNQAKKDLAAAKIDGVILESSNNSGPIKLLVDKAHAAEAAFVANAINLSIIQAYSQKNMPIIKLIYLNRTVPTRWISLPIWLIQIILTVCLLQAAAAVSDEKERQTIHSLLVSPMTVHDYIASKMIWNALIGTGSVLLTLILTGAVVNYGAILTYSFLGCLVYAAVSILIGLLSPSALFARTIATLTYIVSALPMMVKDLSFHWKGILDLLPSNLIMYGLERALLPNPFNGIFLLNIAVILSETLFLIAITYMALKHKADF